MPVRMTSMPVSRALILKDLPSCRIHVCSYTRREELREQGIPFDEYRSARTIEAIITHFPTEKRSLCGNESKIFATDTAVEFRLPNVTHPSSFRKRDTFSDLAHACKMCGREQNIQHIKK